MPSWAEWNALFTVVGGESTAGKALKSQTGWEDNGNGTDAFGFAALPAGFRNDYVNFYDGGDHAYFWSSTEGDSGTAYRMYLYYDFEIASLYEYEKDFGFSVRCVKD